MGEINLDNTGSGSSVTLSSDGTSLLLDGTAIGGGGGSAFTAPEVKTSSWSVTNSDKGKVYIVDTDNLTLTLPEDSTLDDDWFIRIYTKGNSFQPSYGQAGDLTIDPQYSLHSGRVNGNTNWTMRARQGGILFVDPEQSNNFIFDTHSINWDIDVNSTANANRANATGWGSVAISGQAAASGTGAISIGYLSSATGNDSVAIGGSSAQAVATDAIALGNSRAGGSGGVAIGIDNNASTYGATGANSIAIGKLAKATGEGAIAIGRDTVASGDDAFAVGESNEATDHNSVAMGFDSVASANFAIAMGYQAAASGNYSVAIGESSTASHANAFSIGKSVQSTAINQINLGGTTDTVRISETYTLPTTDGTANQVLTTNGSGVVSFATAGGGFDADFVIADKTSAYTVVAGDAGKVISHSANNITITLTAASTLGAGFHVWIKNDAAAGDITTIYFANAGNDSLDGRTGSTKLFRGESIHIYTDGSTFYSLDRTIMWTGNNDTSGSAGPEAPGAGSVAAGHQASATGADSVAIGFSATATSQGSFAIGESTTASSNYALALGYLNTASGFKSIAMGDASTASHTNSVSIGDSVQSTAANQINLGSTADTVRISETYTLPTSDGSANQVLTTNGSGVVSFADAGGGGADLYAANESSPTAQPSATGANAIAIGDSSVASGQRGTAIGFSADASGFNSVSIGNGAATNSNAIAIGLNSSSTGTQSIAVGYNAVSVGSSSHASTDSYASGTNSFAAAIVNNTSSYGATGTRSVAIGDRAKSAGYGGIAIGQRATASGNYSMALGAGNGVVEATTAEAIAVGTGAYSNLTGKLAFSSGTFGTSLGHAQTGIWVLRRSTTDATPNVLATTASGGTTLNQVSLPNNSALSFHGTIVARQQASQGTASAAWKVEGLIRREGTLASTVLVNSATTVLDNTPSWGIALSADTTNGSLKIEVTGAASTNIRWVGTIHTSEVTYA